MMWHMRHRIFVRLENVQASMLRHAIIRRLKKGLLGICNNDGTWLSLSDERSDRDVLVRDTPMENS